MRRKAHATDLSSEEIVKDIRRMTPPARQPLLAGGRLDRNTLRIREAALVLGAAQTGAGVAESLLRAYPEAGDRFGGS